MQYPTLRAEMARVGVKTKDITELLGVSRKTTTNKLSGKSDFTSKEMRKVRDKFFPHMTIGFLFFDE